VDEVSGNGSLHRAAARTSSDTNLSRRVFSLPEETRRTLRRRNTSGNSRARIIPYPTGRFFRGTFPQALRARLRSCCPYGTRWQRYRNSIQRKPVDIVPEGERGTLSQALRARLRSELSSGARWQTFRNSIQLEGSVSGFPTAIVGAGATVKVPLVVER
jgi:hypothetical protein